MIKYLNYNSIIKKSLSWFKLLIITLLISELSTPIVSLNYIKHIFRKKLLKAKPIKYKNKITLYQNNLNELLNILIKTIAIKFNKNFTSIYENDIKKLSLTWEEYNDLQLIINEFLKNIDEKYVNIAPYLFGSIDLNFKTNGVDITIDFNKKFIISTKINNNKLKDYFIDSNKYNEDKDQINNLRAIIINTIQEIKLLQNSIDMFHYNIQKIYMNEIWLTMDSQDQIQKIINEFLENINEQYIHLKNHLNGSINIHFAHNKISVTTNIHRPFFIYSKINHRFHTSYLNNLSSYDQDKKQLNNIIMDLSDGAKTIESLQKSLNELLKDFNNDIFIIAKNDDKNYTEYVIPLKKSEDLQKIINKFNENIDEKYIQWRKYLRGYIKINATKTAIYVTVKNNMYFAITTLFNEEYIKGYWKYLDRYKKNKEDSLTMIEKLTMMAKAQDSYHKALDNLMETTSLKFKKNFTKHYDEHKIQLNLSDKDEFEKIIANFVKNIDKETVEFYDYLWGRVHLLIAENNINMIIDYNTTKHTKSSEYRDYNKALIVVDNSISSNFYFFNPEKIMEDKEELSHCFTIKRKNHNIIDPLQKSLNKSLKIFENDIKKIGKKVKNKYENYWIIDPEDFNQLQEIIDKFTKKININHVKYREYLNGGIDINDSYDDQNSIKIYIKNNCFFNIDTLVKTYFLRENKYQKNKKDLLNIIGKVDHYGKKSFISQKLWQNLFNDFKNNLKSSVKISNDFQNNFKSPVKIIDFVDNSNSKKLSKILEGLWLSNEGYNSVIKIKITQDNIQEILNIFHQLIQNIDEEYIFIKNNRIGRIVIEINNQEISIIMDDSYNFPNKFIMIKIGYEDFANDLFMIPKNFQQDKEKFFILLESLMEQEINN